MTLPPSYSLGDAKNLAMRLGVPRRPVAPCEVHAGRRDDPDAVATYGRQAWKMSPEKGEKSSHKYW